MSVKVWYEINHDELKFAMWKDLGNRERAVFIGQNTWKVFQPNELIPPEAMHTLCDAQGFLDALLQAGIRPSSDAWSAGHVADLKAHITFAERMADRLLSSSLQRPVE